VPEHLRDITTARIRRLPAPTRAALLASAALARPTTAIVDGADLLPAEEAGLVEIEIDGRIAFTHPLFAAAVYADATSAKRRQMHGRLANVVADPEDRARHLALAASGPDGAVAALLSQAAARARSRGAPNASADLEELALRLTPSEAVEETLRRTIALGDSLHLTGQADRARQALESALQHVAPGDLRSDVLAKLGEICSENDRPAGIAYCEQALTEAKSPGPLARAHAALGWMHEMTDLRRAAVHSSAAAELYDEAESPAEPSPRSTAGKATGRSPRRAQSAHSNLPSSADPRPCARLRSARERPSTPIAAGSNRPEQGCEPARRFSGRRPSPGSPMRTGPCSARSSSLFATGRRPTESSHAPATR
jgi:hypothetical protein